MCAAGTLYLAWQASSALGISIASFLPLAGLARVAGAALLAASVLLPDWWTATLGLAGVVLASTCYAACFLALLRALRVPEALDLQRRLRALRAARATV
jgi:hypothetical protein